MRKTSKFKRFLSLLLTLCMVLGMVNVPVAHAASSGEQMLYLNPSMWNVDGARFAAYFYGDNTTWVSMADSDGNGTYEVAVPAGGYTHVIFCRMNGSTTSNNWDNKWNQSGDLTISGQIGKCFTPSAWDKSTSTWSTYSNSYTLTFDMNGHGDAIEAMTVPEGGKGVSPTAPTEENFAFGGWYTDAACTSAEYTFDSVITKDLTLYAKWVEVTREYTVTFDTNNHGEAPEAQTIAEGLKAAKPADPTADGWLFTGWYTEPEYENLYDFNAPVTGDLTLYAKWLEIKDLTVTLHYKKAAGLTGTTNAWVWDEAGATLPGYEVYHDEWPGGEVRDTDDDGWYDLTVVTKTGKTVNFIFSNNSDNLTGDMTTGVLFADVELWVQGNEIFTEKPVISYYVVGDAGLCGTNWDTTNENNKMTLVDGLYTLVYSEVAAGTYEFKVFSNGTWYGNGESNVKITVPKQGDVTIRFNPANGAITAVLPQLETYTVTFDNNGRGTDTAPLPVTEGGKITAPAAPTAEGYQFDGWYKDAPCTNAWDFANDTVTGDITLYAKWTVKQYTITFDTNGGSEIPAITLDYGSAITAPADPTREGFNFAGWDKTIPATMPAEDLTVTAQWTEIVLGSFVVVFNMNGHGEAIESKTVTEGELVSRPADPSAEGYTFGGWFTDADCTTPYDFDAAVTENTTLYAKWTVNQYTITFNTDGGSEIPAITLDYGAAITAPADPTRDGFTFAGWDMTIPTTMPAENLTITAQWTENVPETEAQVIYFKPNSNWMQANARFAAYFFNNGEQWVSMTDSDNDGVYEVTVPAGFDKVIFVRMDPNSVTNSWDTKWNQTGDLTIPTDGKNCFTLDEGTKWDDVTGAWSSYTPPEEPVPVTYVVAGAVNGSDVNAGPFGTAWDPTNMDNLMVLNEVTGLFEITYTDIAAGTYAFKVTNGSWAQSWPIGDANFVFELETESDFTITFDPQTWQIRVLVDGEEQKPAQPDYYLVGWIENADYTGNDYKFEDGKLTVTFGATSYVYVKDSNGTSYYAAAYCTDTAVSLKAGNNEKMQAPANVELQYTLVVNGDGTLTLSYTIVVDEPEIPEDWNTVTIHFLKPTTWGSMVNAYLWTDEGALPNYESFNTWPGSPISGNAEKAGWYDIVVATEEEQAFNFIFNDGGNQTADMTNADYVGASELWVVNGEIYTTAPLEWTSYTVTVHFQKPDFWGGASAYAWQGIDEALLGAWPGTPASPSVNPGWYNAIVYVEIGEELKIIFNDGGNDSGNKTADINLGNITGNAELWLNRDGARVDKPAGWVDETRTIHLPGTLGGNNWDASGNQLEYDAERGLYTITFENVIPGTYEYKIAVNGGWAENYGAGGEVGGANMSVTVTETQDVTFWYSDSSHRVVCSVNYDIDAVVTLSGTSIPEGTRLTDTELDGLFTATIYLSAGKYTDLKIVCGEVEVSFHEFIMTEGKNVTFSFDPSTGMGYHNGSNLKVDTTHIYYNTKDLDYKDPFGAVAVGESVRFSITTGTDATGVVLVIKGVGSVALEKAGEAVDGVQRWTCTYAFESIGEYDYYFSITNGSDMVIYCDDIYNNYYRTGDYGSGGIGNPNDIFAYDIVVHTADFETPDWMKDAVIYQIFPDRFFDAKEYNNDDQTTARGTVDYEYVNDWYMLPENPEMAGKPGYPSYALNGDGEWSNEIYGGDLAGITERIEYLKALGVTVIYLNPVFSSISNHRYDACDYMEIDPILGTLGDFEELVAIAEANGMHIILDGVFNHVSDDSVYFDRYYKFLPLAAERYDGKIGAYPYWAYVYDLMNEQGYSRTAAESAAKTYFAEEYGITDFSYTEWFHVNNEKATYSDTIGLRAGKKVYTYEGWWGYDSMPVIKSTNGSEFQTGNWAEEMLSHENPESVNSYWITKGMDGWRLDVANEVSDETWQNFRDSVKALDSEAVIIGEIWADATRYLMGDMYDSVMNYVFRDAVAGFARGYHINRDNKAECWDNDYIAADAITTLEILRERYPEEAFYAMMNLVGSHDTARILSYLDNVEDDRYQKDMANNFPMYETTSERAKQLQYVVAFIQFTYAGAPTIYYGDEIGMTGCDDPDDRRAFEWGKGQKDLVEWYATLAAIRAQYPALRTGSVEPFAPHRDVMGYVRSDSENTLTVMANRASSDKTIALEGTYVDLISGQTFTDFIVVPAYSGVILVAADEVKEYTVDTEALAPAYDPAYIVPMRDTTPPADPEAKIFTVTFNMNGHGTVIEAQTVTEGEKVTKPVDPTADGFTFGGWFTDADCTTPYDFDAAVTSDLTLYAKWTENIVEPEPEPDPEPETYTVSFNMNGHGTAIEAQTVTEGEKVTKPADPAADGFTFRGWFTDADCTVPYDFDTAVTSDITLYAKWTKNPVDPAPIIPGPAPKPEPKPEPDPEPDPEPEVNYTEIYQDLDDDAWYSDSVVFMIKAGLMNGVGETEFAPEAELSRAMMWTILARLTGETPSAGEFWYTESQEWAVKAGISDGVDPDASITREQLVVMLWRYMGEPDSSTVLSGYSDADSVSDWAAKAMAWAVEIGLVNGVTPTTLEPGSNTTRAQVATLIQRFCEKFDLILAP